MSSNSQLLSGQVAVVTGASSGVGKATAKVLAAAGAKVCLGARRVELLQGVVDGIKASGGHALAVQTDISNRKQVGNLIAAAVKEYGPVDILVNNAGVWYMTMMTSLHEDDWNTMIDVNCKGTLHAIAAVLNGMVSRKKGHIVNISSDSGIHATQGMAVYSGTKYFLEGMTIGLRQEVAKHNIKVTSVQPGYIDAPDKFSPKGQKDMEAFTMCAPPPDLEVLQPEDVAQAVLHAVSQPARVAINEVLVQPCGQPL